MSSRYMLVFFAAAIFAAGFAESYGPEATDRRSIPARGPSRRCRCVSLTIRQCDRRTGGSWRAAIIAVIQDVGARLIMDR